MKDAVHFHLDDCIPSHQREAPTSLLQLFFWRTLGAGTGRAEVDGAEVLVDTGRLGTDPGWMRNSAIFCKNCWLAIAGLQASYSKPRFSGVRYASRNINDLIASVLPTTRPELERVPISRLNE
jgi:hypothetical protein